MIRRVFYDLEFLEDGRTIDVISIGMVDDRGRSLYLINEHAPWDRIAAHPWLMANVVPHLPRDERYHDHAAGGVDLDHPSMRLPGPLARDVEAFLVGDTLAGDELELWAWYGAYDHVALMQLWGPMIDKPAGLPMFTMDLRQEQRRLGDPVLSEQPADAHDALADARHNRVRWAELTAYARRAAAGLPLNPDESGLTVPCTGECGTDTDGNPHDAHLAPGALERLGSGAT
jgi:hypothetical protein